jgi:thymidylate synthase (FAD)
VDTRTTGDKVDMRLVEQSWQWLHKPALPLELIETAGRICYKSESKIAPGTAEKFVKMILSLGHESVIEHVSATIKFVTNRGVTHELVRHRLCSFSQESTRYVRYDKDDITFIRPVWWDTMSAEAQKRWRAALENAETAYIKALENDFKPEEARELLPHALKTEIIVTANLREWRHMFKLRCSQAAHPQFRALMCDCLQGFAQEIPIVFDDLVNQYVNKT